AENAARTATESDNVTVHSEGLREFRQALRRVEGDAPNQLRIALSDVADIVDQGTKPQVPVRRGHAHGSVQDQSPQEKARVVAGGKRVPYYPWLDFGGRVGRKNATVREFVKDGRYLFPTYRQLRDRGVIEERLVRAIVRVARSVGWEVTGG